MINNFTLEEQIILFLYNELNEIQREALLVQIASNKESYEIYQSFSFMHSELNKLDENPSDKVINNILLYAEQKNLPNN